MRDINHLYDHTDQKEIDICHSAILPLASYYGETLSAYFLDMERRGTDSRVIDVADKIQRYRAGRREYQLHRARHRADDRQKTEARF